MVWREQKVVRQAEGNELCSANTYCSRIQVIRVWEREWVCIWMCVCFDVCSCVIALGEGSGGVCACIYRRVCVVMKGSIYCLCCRMLFSSCFSPPPLSLDWWQWAEVRGQQYQCNTIHHTCQTVRPAAWDKRQKLAFHPSPSLPSSVAACISLYISIIAPHVINDFRRHIISISLDENRVLLTSTFHILSLVS